MKTITDIIREIISGICPRSETGHIMSMLAIEMAYEGRFLC